MAGCFFRPANLLGRVSGWLAGTSLALVLVEQLPLNIRPELQEEVAQAAVSQRDGRAADGQSHAAITLRLVGVGDRARGERSQHVGEVEGVAAGIFPGDKLLLKRAIDA